jgi:glutamine synthetase
MYAEGHKARGVKRLPLNLLDALRELQRDRVFAAALGEETVAAYAKLRQAEWRDYTRHFTEWERANALDC